MKRIKSRRIFRGDLTNKRHLFDCQRISLATKLNNPWIMQIHFHTFRHWNATIEYAKTRDILYVMRSLGHKNIENTLRYTQLIDFGNDKYVSKVARTVWDTCELVELGFEYVCEMGNDKIFRKRK